MVRMLWESSYSVGVEKVDEQHKKLVEIIGTFYDILVGDESDYVEKRDAVFQDLVEYTVYHFRYEEKLFEEMDYFAKDPHMLQHSMFVEQVQMQLKDLLNSDKAKGEEFYNFLSFWLLGHISQSDKLFCRRYLSYLEEARKNG